MGGRPVRVACITVEHQGTGFQRLFEFLLIECNCLVMVVRTYNFEFHAIARQPPAVCEIPRFIAAARAIRRCACSNSFSILNGSATARHQSMNCDWSSAKHLRGLARVSIVRLWANNRCSYLISSPMVAPIRSYLAAAGLDVAKA